MSDMASLEFRLNGIMDAETEKDYENADVGLVIECSEALLRMDNAQRYQLLAEEYRASQRLIFGKKSQIRVFSKKKIRVLIVAAILLLLSVLAVTAYEMNKYDIIEFPGFFSVITDKKHHSLVKELTVGYIPEGFTEAEHIREKYIERKNYHKGDKEIYISRTSAYDVFMADNEHGEIKEMEINGIKYTIYGGMENQSSVMWIFNDCLYSIFGDVDAEEIIKIAMLVK